MIKKIIAIEFVLIAAFAGAYLYERSSTEQIVERRIIELVPSVTALCKDGTYSSGEKKRGQCSSHGGVQKFIIRSQ